MAWRRISVAFAIAVAALFLVAVGAGADDPPVVEGPLEADQSPAGADETSSTPGTPAPVSGSGPPGSFTRELWSEEEVGAENGLSVVSSTAAGTFALTGVALDGSTGGPVAGARVFLIDPYPLCHRPERASRSEGAGGPSGCGSPRTVASTTADSRGAFAFINIPMAPYLHLRVERAGFGTYEVRNVRYFENETYVTTVELGPTAQTYDESGTKADSTRTGASVGSGYDSNGRIPPSLLVARFPQTRPGCEQAGSLLSVRRYPWRFYVLHTMSGEIFGSDFPNGAFKIAAAKANAQAISSYAWYHRIRSTAAGSADVDNTTRFQCFKPHMPVMRKWRTWVEDPLDERIADANNDILLTQYRRGTYSCVEGGDHAPDNNILSQLGSKAREEQCGVNDWRSLDNWYYTGNVTGGLLPPRPQTSHTALQGGIRFNFESKVGNSLVGWRYQVERFVGAPVDWSRIYNRGWVWANREIPTTFTFTTTGTRKYRARACSPVGCSAYASFNGGNPIAPLPGPGG
jgi:hypothetical protein